MPNASGSAGPTAPLLPGLAPSRVEALLSGVARWRVDAVDPLPADGAAGESTTLEEALAEALATAAAVAREALDRAEGAEQRERWVRAAASAYDLLFSGTDERPLGLFTRQARRAAEADFSTLTLVDAPGTACGPRPGRGSPPCAGPASTGRAASRAR